MSDIKAEGFKKLTKSELRPKFARDANIGMTHLWNLGHQALSIHPGLAGYYMSQFQKRSIFSEVAIQDKIKPNYCQACGNIFVPGATCSVKLKAKDIPPQRSETSDAKSCPIKPRTYNFKNSIKIEKNASGSDGSKTKRGSKHCKSLRFSCSLCHANTFVPVPIRPKSATPTTSPFKAPIPHPNTQRSKTSDSNTPLNIGKPSKDIFKEDNNAKKMTAAKPVAQTAKNMKQAFQPKPCAKKKGTKLNLSKILENDRKAKEEAKSKPQGFSLGDFLKDFN